MRQIRACLAKLKTADNPKTERRLLLSEVEDLLKSDDDGTVEQRDVPIDTTQVDKVLAELTVRQRAILIAVLRGDGSRRTIARRFGISASRLDIELSQALALASEAIQHLRRTPRLR